MKEPVSFLAGSNIYEVNVRQYTQEGTFKAFSLHLPRLRDMGVDILWFMPLTPISVHNRKGTLGSYYAAADYTSINPEFGTESDFSKLVKKAHALGFKVIIDWVANHTGWDHTWTKKHPDYYIKDHRGLFTERNGWEDVIDLDFSNDSMRKSMIDSMAYWINEFNLDGFRCDMAMLVSLEFWHQARTVLDQIKPLFWLAECEDVNYFKVFDVMYAWEWMHSTHAVAQGHTQRDSLKDLLTHYSSRKGIPKRYLYFTSNHDENSWNGTEYERYGLLSVPLAAIAMLLPDGIPLIYSGQELPLKRRLFFFDKDWIPWDHHVPALHQFYKVILNLRKSNIWFTGHHGYTCTINKLTHHINVFTLHIGVLHEQDIIAFFNLKNEEVNFEIINISSSHTYVNIFTGEEVKINAPSHASLKAGEFRIYLNKN